MNVEHRTSNIEHRIMYSACRESFVERSIFETTERRVVSSCGVVARRAKPQAEGDVWGRSSKSEAPSLKRFRPSTFDIRYSAVLRFAFNEVSDKVSGVSPAACHETASLIDKETPAQHMSNVESRNSFYFIQFGPRSSVLTTQSTVHIARSLLLSPRHSDLFFAFQLRALSFPPFSFQL